jgi:hypothetical protein
LLQSDDAPERFDASEGNAADGEAVGAGQSATDREESDEGAMASLERVRQRHYGHGSGPEGGHSRISPRSSR